LDFLDLTFLLSKHFYSAGTRALADEGSDELHLSLPSNWLCAHQKLPLWLLELKLGNQNINPTKSKQPCGRRVIRSAFAQQDKSREQTQLTLSIRKSNGGPKPKRSSLFSPCWVCVDSLHLPLRSPCNKTGARVEAKDTE
jgi:hypothetical protein